VKQEIEVVMTGTTPIEATELLDLVAAGQRQFWAGDHPPFSFNHAHLWGSTNFRLSSGHHGRYDVVWYYEQLFSELKQDQHLLMLDELVRLLGERGTLVVRYQQNRHFSVIQLKRWLFRRYGCEVRVKWEQAQSGIFTTIFELERRDVARYRDRSWTFAVLTSGKRNDNVIRLLESIHREDPDRNHQVVICGPSDSAYEPFDVGYQPGDYREELAEISRKKNDIADRARGANLLIAHDRYVLSPGFLNGFDQYGYDFDFVAIPQFYECGTRYPAYCALDNDSLTWCEAIDCRDYNRVRAGQYINGGLIIAKTHTLRDLKFNDLLFWNQAEDVELARTFRENGIPPRINAFSSAVTIGITPEHTSKFRTDDELLEETPVKRQSWTRELKQRAKAITKRTEQGIRPYIHYVGRKVGLRRAS
jgi:hypothetical protein